MINKQNKIKAFNKYYIIDKLLLVKENQTTQACTN